MNTEDALSNVNLENSENNTTSHGTNQTSTLRDSVAQSLGNFFEQIDNQPVTNLYEMVLSEIEAPLLEAVMRYTGSNQSKASIMLGLNRGTLRKKLKQYGLL